MNPYLKQYQRTEVETATPEKVLILLYDGAIQFLNKALISIDEKNHAETYNNIVGAEHIILEFMNTLDFEQGGDFAVRLNALYQYFYNRLIEANMKKDKEIVKQVLDFLVDLRATWKQAINMTKPEASKAQPSENQDSIYVSNEEDDDEDYDDEDDEYEDDDDEEESDGYDA